MDIPADSVPTELKPACEQILRRARELRKADPVMSYWCCFSAASASMRLPIKRSPEANKFLMNLLTVLEDMKASLLKSTASIEHSTITDEAAGSAYVENFGMKVFLQADDEDRAGKASKATVRKFIVAAQFIEVLRCFDPPNGMRDELEQKLLYARWKAADIAKALKEGRTPTAGPRESFLLPKSETAPKETNPILGMVAGEETTDDDPLHPDRTTEDESFPKTLPSLPDGPFQTEHHRDLPSTSEPDQQTLHIPPPLGRQDSSNSGTWSTVVTPGIEPESASPNETSHLPSPPVGIEQPPHTGTTTTTPTPTRRPSLGGLRQPHPEASAEKKEVRFAGPDGAPLSPSATVVTLDSYSTPDAPPPSEFTDLGGADDARLPQGALPPTAIVKSDQPDLTVGEDEATVRFPTIPLVPPPAERSLPSAPATTPSPDAQPLPSAPSAPRETVPVPVPVQTQPQAYPTDLDSKSIERCQKHARWAISALDYEDLETARKELRLALDLLEGR
ncbi:hypothetical protein QFC21_003302 [Naganishia friedmannii]|uniref:Uncharacterized protein n=1 Tax=Naganishia friedmannii TaxID=89922 RepID=A0ACC2VPZ7_9TREE|nr:hypothetical protein QFC21_003302 [Naganishia friedmannii]